MVDSPSEEVPVVVLAEEVLVLVLAVEVLVVVLAEEVVVVVLAEEVVVVVLAKEVLVVLPWLDEHVCRCWVVPGGGQASLQASLHESVAKCNYVK